ncbi:MAG TPA: hypothetical protein VJB60_01250 [Candidatus Peribacterales bacterium]|nr:hypothetical protein [Candidatus Peribacterales bacterium]
MDSFQFTPELELEARTSFGNWRGDNADSMDIEPVDQLDRLIDALFPQEIEPVFGKAVLRGLRERYRDTLGKAVSDLSPLAGVDDRELEDFAFDCSSNTANMKPDQALQHVTNELRKLCEATTTSVAAPSPVSGVKSAE